MTDEELKKKAKESYWNSDANGGLSSEKNYILGFISGVKENEQEKCELLRKYGEVNDQLNKAKDLIRNLLRVTYGEGWNYSLDWKVKAEQFLKE